MDRLTAERYNELHGLRFHWGQYYGFTMTSGRWSAARLDNRRVIVRGQRRRAVDQGR